VHHHRDAQLGGRPEDDVGHRQYRRGGVRLGVKLDRFEAERVHTAAELLHVILLTDERGDACHAEHASTLSLRELRDRVVGRTRISTGSE